MKLPKFNQQGITHILAPILFIGIFAVIGSIILTRSNALVTCACSGGGISDRLNMLFRENSGNQYLYQYKGTATKLFNFDYNSTKGVQATYGLNSANIFYFGGESNASLYKADKLGQNGAAIAKLPTATTGTFYYDISWSEASQKLVFAADDFVTQGSYIYTINPDGSNITQVYSSTSQGNAPSWSPDGSKLLITVPDSKTNNSFYAIINASTKAVYTVPRPLQYGCNNPKGVFNHTAWITNNSIVCDAGWGIGKQNINGTSPVSLYNLPRNSAGYLADTIGAMALSPDKTTVAFTTTNTTNTTTSGGTVASPYQTCKIYLLPVSGGTPTKIYSGTTGECDEVDFSPNSWRIAFTTRDASGSATYPGTLNTITTAGSGLTKLFTEPPQYHGSAPIGLTWQIQ